MTTRTEPRPAAAHVPPTPPPPAPAGMALTELLAALEGERRTHAAAVRAGSTRQEATMREPTMREPDAHAGASEPTAGVCPTCGGKRWLRAPVPHDEVLPGRSCPDCSDGVWTPPDSPVPIGVTSARPEVAAHDAHACSSEPTAGVYGASSTLTAGHPQPRFPAVTRLDEELGALEDFHVPATINHLRDLAYSSAVAAGWHDPKLIDGVMREPSAGERVALIHEEATELLQHVRDGRPAGGDVWAPPLTPSEKPKPDSAGYELADIVIRCLDYAGRYEIPLGELIAAKMRYNRERAHRHGGRTL